jgi:CheY-like chemotaxis protein
MAVEFANVRVLVVEDHDQMRAILVTALRGLGFPQIREAADAAEALRVVADFAPDLILTDLIMPAQDGVQFARAVRAADGEGAFVPIIMVTGHPSLARVTAARDAGVDEFLAKPVTGQALAERIRRVVEERRAFVRSGDFFGPDRRRRATPGWRGPFRRADDRPAA